jgi:hypothetical protein
LKTKWGFAKLLSHETLNNSSYGLLVDDTCVFGVGVSVIKATGKGETLSMVNEPELNYFTWRIDNFTGMKDEVYHSKRFTLKGRRWYDWCFALLGLLILFVYNHLTLYFGYI